MPMPRGHQVHAYDRERFGAELRSARIRLGLSLSALADAAALNKGSLHATERGRRSLPPATRQAIVIALEQRANADGIGIDGDRLRALANLETPAIPPTTVARSPSLLLLPSPGPSQTWHASLMEGHRLAANLAPELARVTYRRAGADADSLAAKALAAAYEAHSWWKQGTYAPTLRLYREALTALGLDELSPDRAPSIQIVAAKLPDETGLAAYALLAQLSGFIHHTRGNFDRSILAYTTWERVSRILSDTTMQADALRYLGKSILEQGTVVEPDDLAWRSAARLDDVRRAIRQFQQARAIRDTSEGPAHADDWRQELRARGVLLASDADRGARRAVHNATTEAMASVGSSITWSRMYLQIDRGYLQLADVNLREAEDLFMEAVDLALAMKTVNAMSAALCGLGLVYSMEPALRQRALDHAIASLMLWNFPFETRDSGKSLHLFHYLRGDPADLHRFMHNDSDLRDLVLLALDGTDSDERVATVLRRLIVIP